MSAALGPFGHKLTEAPGYARAEFAYGNATEIGELFRALAVACIKKPVTRVLVIAGDDEPAGERALRDALTAMVLAGIPDGFRLAVVAALPRVMRTYRNAPGDFTAAGIPTRLFEGEAEALQWLERAPGRARAGSFQSAGSPDSRGMPRRPDPQSPES